MSLVDELRGDGDCCSDALGIPKERSIGHRAASEIERLRAALQKIANADYRGNRSTEMTTAYEALKVNP